MGTVSFKVSIANSQASKAAFLCAEETAIITGISPILSSQCVLPFVVKNTTLQAFIQQLRTTYKERQIYLHLYRATSSTYTTTKPIWSGFLVMDLGSGEDVSFPYEQKLTFVDGLSLLK